MLKTKILLSKLQSAFPYPSPEGARETNKMGRVKRKNAMKNIDWKTVKFLEKKSLEIDENEHFNPEKYCQQIDKKLQVYKTSRRAKFTANYHFVFVTKGRVKVLFKEVRQLIEKYIPIFAKEYNWETLAVEVMPNHMHIFVTLDNNTAPKKYVHCIRTMLENWLYKLFPILERALSKNIFSRSYYFGTVGNVTSIGVMKYINQQWKEYSGSSDKYKKAVQYIDKKNTSLTKFF